MNRIFKVFICHRHYGTNRNIRVRFAPSPTGTLHLGGLRTAFFNYLFARKNNGKFVLRIEDTDQKRVKPESTENLNAMLKWTGLIPDESPFVEGPFSPYIQSKRLSIYQEKANDLLKSGAAYRCFCSEMRLNILKMEATQQRGTYGYDNKCRHLQSDEVEDLLKERKPFTIRFKIPNKSVTHKDIVFGDYTYNVSENEGDFVILKSDGFPTYHFASVVDDHAMEISHVLRGTEWLISTPKHIMLYEAFGWNPPQFAHLPLLTNSDRSKLSKRQESIGIQYFKEKGYAPEALLNFLAGAGGGFGKQEGCISHSIDTLCSKFNLEQVNMASHIVDLRKLDLFNQNYLIKQLSDADSAMKLVSELRVLLKDKYGERYEREEKNLSDSYIKKILELYKDRMYTLHSLIDPDLEYLWTAVNINEVKAKFSTLKIPEEAVLGLKNVSAMLSEVPEEDFTQDYLSKQLKEISTNLKIKYSAIMRALRVTLTAQKDGPGLAEMLETLGKKRSIEKICLLENEVS